jgi:hypothetical protein
MSEEYWEVVVANSNEAVGCNPSQRTIRKISNFEARDPGLIISENKSRTTKDSVEFNREYRHGKEEKRLKDVREVIGGIDDGNTGVVCNIGEKLTRGRKRDIVDPAT